MRIYIVGSLNMDLVIRAPRAPKGGETLSGEGFMTNPGGKGANQAVAVAKLGGESYMVGCVGREFGKELTDALKEYGVHADHVRTESDISSGIAVITVVDGDNRIILDAGSNGRADGALVDRALADAKAGDYLLVQLEIGLPTVSHALKEAKKRGMITVLNPAPARELPKELYADCDWFVPNQIEAEFYTGIYPSDEKSVRQCAEKLGELGVKNVLITLGMDGSASVSEGAFRRVDVVPAEAIDTTAAGDTYVGAFVTRLSEGADVETAMRFASTASALTVTRRGAQRAIPIRSEVEAYAKEKGIFV
ncbi:MAG: ribokinase [Clostridia bacterium]|nr:ribokinase [Clostridia bacterium]